MVVGAGSESFELLRSIVELLPVMPVPDSLESETQPIGIDDVVSYLRAALDVPESAGREIQIGGPDVVTHREAIEAMARALGRRAPRAIPMSDEIARPATVAAGAAALTSGTPRGRRRAQLRAARADRSSATRAAPSCSISARARSTT